MGLFLHAAPVAACVGCHRSLRVHLRGSSSSAFRNQSESQRVITSHFLEYKIEGFSEKPFNRCLFSEFRTFGFCPHPLGFKQDLEITVL